MELLLRDGDGVSSVDVPDSVFGVDFRPSLVHQVVNAYLAGGRAGTKAQKNRSAVRGGGTKPYRQKGTGRARAGTTRSPLWRGGGVTFMARPKDWSQKVNRKMYRGAVRSILSELARQARLVVLTDLTLEAAKTKLLRSKLRALELERCLIVVAAAGDPVFLAARNLPAVDVLTASAVDPVSLVSSEHVVITREALSLLAERLQ